MGYGGPAAVNSCHEKQNVWSALLEKADEIALEQKADWFKVALPPLARAYLPTSGQIINPLILRGFADIPSFGYMVDLAKSEETLWNNLGNKTRNLIRKAEKEKISVRKSTEKNDLATFYRLHKENRKNTGAKPLPYSYFEEIWAKFVTKGLANFF
ncbi:MAG: peptidoglycan bridge formation glycyltransferase FemA/FemB family protein [Candidatus Micrarchaeia archaeon]